MPQPLLQMKTPNNFLNVVEVILPAHVIIDCVPPFLIQLKNGVAMSPTASAD
jgi:hypothetical protein